MTRVRPALPYGRVLAALAAGDAKLVRRDAYLLGVVLIPFITAFLLHFGWPPLARLLLVEWGLSLEPYRALAAAYLLVLMTPLAIGVIGGFLLLDERDDRTLQALRVTPLPVRLFLAYRSVVTAVVSFVLVPLVVRFADIVEIPLAPLLLVAAVASLVAPLAMLFFGAFAANKVQGFGLQKLLNGLLLLPIAAYFLPLPAQLAAAAAFPPTWPARAFWLYAEGQPGAGMSLLFGTATMLALIVVLARQFERRAD